MSAKRLNYKIVRSWTDGRGHRWFTVAWGNGERTTHSMTEMADLADQLGVTAA